MNRYQFYIDIMLDCEMEDIKVVSGSLKANTPEEAEELVIELMEEGMIDDVPEEYHSYYVWEISDADIICED